MHRRFILLLLLSAAVLTGCASEEIFCPSPLPVDMANANTYPEEDELPFMFPITDEGFDQLPFMANFADRGHVASGGQGYHAAEDYEFPPGTPVYAMADGESELFRAHGRLRLAGDR